MREIVKQKKEFYRKALIDRREAIDPAHRAAASREICERIRQSSYYRAAKTLLCYAPVAQETDISSLFEAALEDGKRLAFPRCEGENLRFYVVEDPLHMPPGSFRIPEPAQNAAPLEDFSEALCICPALSVDARGYRLGYGRGFYDRFLKEHPNMTTLVPLFDILRLETIPAEEWDIRISLVVTEKQEWVCHEG